MTDYTSPSDIAVYELGRLNLFVESCREGLDRYAREEKGWLEVSIRLSKRNNPDLSVSEEALEKANSHAEELEKFANSEASNNHPYLYGSAIVRLWLILETFADDLILQHFLDRKVEADSPLLAGLKVPLTEYIVADDNEKAAIALRELKQSIRTRQLFGVSRIEALVEAVGLSGSLDSDIRKTIFECHQVRNVVVHRGGIADARFIKACPWFGAQVGSPLPFSLNFYGLHVNAIGYYINKITIRQNGETTENLDTDKYLLTNVRNLLADRESRKPESLSR